MPAAAKRELEKYAATLPEGDTLPQSVAADGSEPISQVPGIVYKDPAGQSQPPTTGPHPRLHSQQLFRWWLGSLSPGGGPASSASSAAQPQLRHPAGADCPPRLPHSPLQPSEDLRKLGGLRSVCCRVHQCVLQSGQCVQSAFQGLGAEKPPNLLRPQLPGHKTSSSCRRP